MPIQILMPALSPTMTEGNLTKWHKAEGDAVSSGDVLAEIETDKATMEIEAVEEGTLGKIIVPEGSEAVPVNQVIALLLEEGEDARALEGVEIKPATAPAAPAQAAAPTAVPVAAPTTPTAITPAPQSTPSDGRVFASPLARRLADGAGLDITALRGSGPRGRIVKRDVEAAIAAGGVPSRATVATTAPSAPIVIDDSGLPPYRVMPHSNVRKVIAARLSASKQQVPHFYLSIDCEIDNLLAARKRLNAQSDDYKLSVNDFVIRAVALALHRVPAANAMWTDDGMRLFDRADVSVAVAIPDGLITPVIRDAGNKGLVALSSEMKDLAARARDSKLAPEEFQGGTFTISNLGMYGIKTFSAIINPPQACILAVGAGEQRPVVRDGELAIATVMDCTLAVDHRAVDGAVGAEFMAALKPLIEDPVNMLL